MIRTHVPDRSAALLRRRAVAAAAALLAAVGLAACGESTHAGAAAVVGGQRISTAAVQARVEAFRDAVASQDQAPQQENAGLARNTVRDMVLSDVVAHALQEHGLTVTDGEIAQARAADAGQLGGEAGLRQALLEQKGVAPAGIDDFYRRALGMQKLAGLNGQDPSTEQGAEALRKALADATRTFKVELNPRYGTWDPQNITFGDGGADWLRSASPAS